MKGASHPANMWLNPSANECIHQVISCARRADGFSSVTLPP
jgi:hypothetical protein